KGVLLKLDIWALGITLLELYSAVMLPEVKELTVGYKRLWKNQEELKNLKVRFIKTIKKEIEGKLRRLETAAKKRALTQEEEYRCLLYKMMRLDPNERIGLGVAKDEINRIIYPNNL